MHGTAAATYEDPSTLVPWARNPRLNDEAVEEIVASIREFGFGAPIVARLEDRRVIAGHTRLKAALAMGLDSVPVRFLDLTEAKADALTLADNRLGERATWDDALLAEILGDLSTNDLDFDLSAVGWTLPEIEGLLVPGEPGGGVGTDTQGDDDAPPPSSAPPDSVPGAVYVLGPHRLVCGDSTVGEAWDLLLEDDDEAPSLLWSDPPYGVALNGDLATSSEARKKKQRKDGKVVSNDALDEAGLDALLSASLGEAVGRLEAGGCVYIAAPPGPLFGIFGAVLGRLGVWRHTLVWLKDRFVLGRADRHYRHEAIFYGWKPGAGHAWIGGRSKDTILEVPRPSSSPDHPTMKPVALIRECLGSHPTEGRIVLDPFAGSGSTMIAASQLGASARLIELDPSYCDVVRRRWTRWASENGLEPGSGALALDVG